MYTTFTPVLSSLLRHITLHVTWCNLFHPTNSLFCCDFFKNTSKIPNFWVDFLYFLGISSPFPVFLTLLPPLFLPFSRPRKTSKAQASARASKPKAWMSSKNVEAQRVKIPLKGKGETSPRHLPCHNLSWWARGVQSPPKRISVPWDHLGCPAGT